jgi:hypothetical protein
MTVGWGIPQTDARLHSGAVIVSESYNFNMNECILHLPAEPDADRVCRYQRKLRDDLLRVDSKQIA